MLPQNEYSKIRGVLVTLSYMP